MSIGTYKRKLKPIKIGQKFGRLTIIKEVKSHIAKNGQKVRKVLCQCNCGNKKEIVYSNLKNGQTKSCGCLHKEIIKKQGKKRKIHGMARTRFYYILNGIKQRCSNKNHKYYGGRGIKCEWNDFIEFKNDMYESYLQHCKEFTEKNTSIDRIDNNGNYNKKNCRWATMKEQSNNTRRNIFITYQNKTQTISQWAKELNIKYRTLLYRIKYYKWSIKKAFEFNKF